MFVGRAKRSAGNRQPVGSAAELYVNGSASESVQWCDCDWGDCGSCDLGDCGLDAVEVADGHKHDCNPDHLEMIAISIRIEKKSK